MSNDVDLKLEILSRTLPRGYTLSPGEIAEFCGLSRQRVQQIEQSAKNKLRKRYSLRKHIEDIRGD